MNPVTAARRGFDRLPHADPAAVVDQQGDLHRLVPDVGRDDLGGVPVLADLELLRREVGHGLAGLVDDRRVHQAELLGRRAPPVRPAPTRQAVTVNATRRVT